MGAILLGIFTALLSSTGDSFRKLAIENSRMSKSLFNLLASILGSIMIVGVFLLFGFNVDLLGDWWYLLLIGVIVSINFVNSFLVIYIYEREKLSVLLPYDSLDKIFIVILGFIFFAGTDQGTSITTFIITLLTIAVIFFSSVDIRKISLPRTVLLYCLSKLIRAVIVLSSGFFLLKYSSVDYVIVDWALYTGMVFLLTIVLKDSHKKMIEQNKVFYKNRVLATILGRSGYILGLYIIQDSGVVIATLLGFFYIAFSVLAMKFIAKDSPSKKQIILAFVVVAMIGVGYYFK